MSKTLNPYNDLYLRKVLGSACWGNRRAKKLLSTIKEPFAIKPDYSALIVVIHDRLRENDDDSIKFEDERYSDKYRAEIYECRKSPIGNEESLISWTYIPIPERFCIYEVIYEQDHNCFSFISKNGDRVVGTIEQFCKAMKREVIYSNEVTEEEIESSFLSISFSSP